MADYVLVWTGGGGDDLGKSGHMARIADSVYKGHCAESDCDQYGVYRDGNPTPMMQPSLIWHITNKEMIENDVFEEVYTSKNGKVRIVKVLDVSVSSKVRVSMMPNQY